MTSVSSRSVLPGDVVTMAGWIDRAAGSRRRDPARCNACSGSCRPCDRRSSCDDPNRSAGYGCIAFRRPPSPDCAPAGSRADFVFAVALALLFGTGECFRPASVAEDAIGVLLEIAKRSQFAAAILTLGSHSTLSSSVSSRKRSSSRASASPSVETLPGPALASTSSPENCGWRNPVGSAEEFRLR